MSYILDALKRADAQRERGQVPGLNAQPAPVATAPTARRRLGWWIGLACSAVAVAAGALYWQADSTQAAPAPSTAPGPAPSPAPVSAPAVVQVPAAVAAPAPLPATTPVPGVQQRPSLPPPSVVRPPAAQPAAAAPARPVPLQRREAASAAAAPVPALGELPEDIRRTVPKLVVSGSVYSSNPSQRILIVNGQVLNEGATLAPDLVLESIGAKSAVLSLRGTRFRLDY